MPKKIKEFKGELGLYITPIKRPTVPGSLQISLNPQVEEDYRQKFIEWRKNKENQFRDTTRKRIPLLLDHYKIQKDDPDCWLLLSLNLAMDYVPGFRFKNNKSAGRPTEWDEAKLTYLFYDIEQWLFKKRLSNEKDNIAQACRALSKTIRWKSGGGYKRLYNNYYKSQKIFFVYILNWARSNSDLAGSKFENVLWDHFFEENPTFKKNIPGN